MLPASSLSRAAYGLRELLMTHIDEVDVIDRIKIGHPGDTIKDLEDFDENCLNLFFYDVNHDGYPSDGTSENPFYVRLHCLITAIGHKSKEPEEAGSSSERDVSSGENELRLIGEVMRILHEQPVLAVDDDDHNEIAQLQIVPHAMNLDALILQVLVCGYRLCSFKQATCPSGRFFVTACRFLISASPDCP